MACREAPTFEDFIRRRLGARSEAAKMIASLSKDTSLSNAVAMTIEALPTRQSHELRHLVDLFEPYCDWVENWEPRGWEITPSSSHVLLRPPKGYEWGQGPHPNNDVIAAAAGVLAVRFDDVEFEPRVEVSFRVVR